MAAFSRADIGAQPAAGAGAGDNKNWEGAALENEVSVLAGRKLYREMRNALSRR